MKIKTLSYLFISTMFASPFALAMDWYYNSVTPEENTKEELNILYGNNFIDTSEGVLTIKNNLKSESANLRISGENNLVIGGQFLTHYGTTILTDANLSAADKIIGQYDATFEIEGTVNETGNVDKEWELQSGTMLNLSQDASLNTGKEIKMVWNAQINLAENSTLTAKSISSLYENETGFSVNIGDNATLTVASGTIEAKSFTLGNGSTVNGSISSSGSLELNDGNIINGNVKATDVVINSGASISGITDFRNSLTVNSGASVKLADYFHLNNTITLNNPGTKAIYSNIEFWLNADSALNIHLGNNSLAAVNDRFKALIYTLYGKAGEGQIGEGAKINVYLSDFVLGEDFVYGEQYKIALICSQYADVSGWESLFNLVDDSDFADFVEGSLVHENNTWWITVQSVPEPSSYAAIFGALALAFAAYRRRKH